MAKKQNSTTDNKKGKGLTLDEIRVKRAVSSFRIELELERLKPMFTQQRKTDPTIPEYIHKLDNILQYSQMAFFSFRIAKKIMRLYQVFRNKR